MTPSAQEIMATLNHIIDKGTHSPWRTTGDGKVGFEMWTLEDNIIWEYIISYIDTPVCV